MVCNIYDLILVQIVNNAKYVLPSSPNSCLRGNEGFTGEFKAFKNI